MAVDFFAAAFLAVDFFAAAFFAVGLFADDALGVDVPVTPALEGRAELLRS